MELNFVTSSLMQNSNCKADCLPNGVNKLLLPIAGLGHRGSFGDGALAVQTCRQL